MIGDGRSRGNVVGDDDDGVEFVHVGDLPDEGAGFFEHEKVEAAEGLVHEKEMIGAQDLLNNGAPLTLAAGELNGVKAGLVEEFEVVEILHDFVVGDFGVFFFLTGGKKEIGHHGAVLEERIVLGNDADFAGLYGPIFAIDSDAARRGFVEAGDDAKELGLADAAWSEETDNLALHTIWPNDVFDLRADVLKDGTAVIFEADVLNLEESFAVGARGGHKGVLFSFQSKSGVWTENSAE